MLFERMLFCKEQKRGSSSFFQQSFFDPTSRFALALTGLPPRFHAVFGLRLSPVSPLIFGPKPLLLFFFSVLVHRLAAVLYCCQFTHTTLRRLSDTVTPKLCIGDLYNAVHRRLLSVMSLYLVA